MRLIEEASCPTSSCLLMFNRASNCPSAIRLVAWVIAVMARVRLRISGSQIIAKTTVSAIVSAIQGLGSKKNSFPMNESDMATRYADIGSGASAMRHRTGTLTQYFVGFVVVARNIARRGKE